MTTNDQEQPDDLSVELLRSEISGMSQEQFSRVAAAVKAEHERRDDPSARVGQMTPHEFEAYKNRVCR
jgi:hypothetical protein